MKLAVFVGAIMLAGPAVAQEAPIATSPAPPSAPTAVDQAGPATQSSAARDSAIPPSIVAPEAEAAARPSRPGRPRPTSSTANSAAMTRMAMAF